MSLRDEGEARAQVLKAGRKAAGEHKNLAGKRGVRLGQVFGGKPLRAQVLSQGDGGALGAGEHHTGRFGGDETL